MKVNLLSDNEPSDCVREAFFCRVWPNSVRWTDCEKTKWPTSSQAPVDRQSFQVLVWNLHVGVGGSTDKSPYCHDVRYVSAHSGNPRLFLIPVQKNPIKSFENLCFAIFGQARIEDLKIAGYDFYTNHNNQPYWTQFLFKATFGAYLLVSVVVLIKLLIAMMTDTYQRIQVK